MNFRTDQSKIPLSWKIVHYEFAGEPNEIKDLTKHHFEIEHNKKKKGFLANLDEHDLSVIQIAPRAIHAIYDNSTILNDAILAYKNDLPQGLLWELELILGNLYNIQNDIEQGYSSTAKPCE